MAKAASNGEASKNGKSGADSKVKDKQDQGAIGAGQPQLDPKIAKRIASVRAQVREGFGKIVMAMMFLPRYRSLPMSDLQHLVLEPLLSDRIAIAYPGGSRGSEPASGPATEGGESKPASARNELADVAGLAIWASVSEDVDAKIRDQVKSGVFPIRLTGKDWISGDINWLLDVIAPDARTTGSVLANFAQVLKAGDKAEGGLRLHPIVAKLVDAETLKRLGIEKSQEARKADDGS